MSKKIAIVSVNYKTAKLACNAIDSVLSCNSSSVLLSIVVVDNNSQDGSVELLNSHIREHQFERFVSVIPMAENGGFAYGSNAGIRPALLDGADYIMLLNPDTEVRENALNALANYLDCHPKAGIVGSQLENVNGGIESSAHNFHSPLGELVEAARLGILTRLLPNHEVTPPRQDDAHQCDWVSGSSMMVRKQVFEEVGLLDEVYFLYFEEVDFFFRVKKAGWQTWYVPASKVMHIEGASTGIKSTKRRPSYWYESRRRFFIKHYGVLGLILADVLWTVGRVSYLIRNVFKRNKKENNDPKWLMYDLLTGDILSVFSTQAWRLQKEKVD